MVNFSPRLAAWIISAVPIAAKSPSPWYVKTSLSGWILFIPVATAGGRPCGASVTSKLNEQIVLSSMSNYLSQYILDNLFDENLIIQGII